MRKKDFACDSLRFVSIFNLFTCHAWCPKGSNQEGGGVSRVNIGRLITTSVTSRHISMDAIHSTKIPTGPTRKRGPPQKVDPFFRNFSGWTEPIH